MMIDRIRKALAGNAQVSDYRITETVKHGLERYVSAGKADMSRSVETTQYSLVVYVDSTGADGEKSRGAYSCVLHPGSLDTEIDAVVSRAVRAAAGMRNPWYPLPEPGIQTKVFPESGFAAVPLAESMALLSGAIQGIAGKGSASLNSSELYLSRNDKHLVNARGIDVRWTGFTGYIEYIVSAAAKGREDVELYGDLEFSEPDLQRVLTEVEHSLKLASDRLVAKPMPVVSGLPLILKDELAAEIYGYWFASSKAQAAYEKTAAFKLDETLADGSGSGDRLALTAVPYLKGNPRSAPYDADGMALSPVACVEGGKLSRLIGPLKYTRYMGLADTGDLPLFELEPGKAGVAELEAGPHIEAVSFSDFFVDENTGDFGGELRLGYLVQGGRRIPVKGGSITGSMVENRGLVRLSRERCLTRTCLAPLAALIPGVSVSASA